MSLSHTHGIGGKAGKVQDGCGLEVFPQYHADPRRIFFEGFHFFDDNSERLSEQLLTSIEPVS